MTWDFSGDRAIYVQIAEQVKLRIIAGNLSGGDAPAVSARTGG